MKITHHFDSSMSFQYDTDLWRLTIESDLYHKVNMDVRVVEESVFHPYTSEDAKDKEIAKIKDRYPNGMWFNKCELNKPCTRITVYEIRSSDDTTGHFVSDSHVIVYRNDNTSVFDVIAEDVARNIAGFMRHHQICDRVNTGHTFPVAVLVGSTRFKEQYYETAAKLYADGYIVLMTHLFSHADSKPLTEEEEEACWQKYKKMIQMSTDMYVINVGGYIGENTRKDIEYGKLLGLKIHYLE